MTLLRDDPELEQPIEDLEQLAEFFRGGETPRAEFRVGTEHEKICLYEKTLSPVPFEGEYGIGALLQLLHREHGFAPLLDGETIVGLERDDATITLEPGGQLELSGAPLYTLHETCREFRQHVALLKQVSGDFGIVWLGLGIHPLAKVDEIPRMPRVRHEIMREYMARSDRLGLSMMHATGTVQANFDFSSEADLAVKLRLGLAASPVVTALWANSSISGGEPNGFESYRAEIWRYTDRRRCGFLPFAFEEGWGEGTAYRRYAEWALDVPLMFIVRDGEHIPLRSSFREFLVQGHAETPATLADWNLHLTTLFPEVRMKRIVEVRGADAVPPDLVCALPAFWKGLFYDPEALATASERLAHWTHADVDGLHADVARRGLQASTPDGPALEVARELVVLARAGLARIDAQNAMGENESLFVEPLEQILDRGTSPGRAIIERWDGAFRQRIDRLVEYAKY
jgi:glutamate--cysteine ligase